MLTKRLIAWLSVLCLLAACMPLSVSAASQTWDFESLEGYYKTQGRVQLSGTALEMDTTSSGFEFYFEGSGSVTLSADIRCSYSTDLYLTVIVDGVRSRLCLDAGAKSTTVSKTVTLASSLSQGIHHIEVYKQSEAIVSLMKATSITFNGTPLSTPPFDKITMEVIGDSISSGASMWSASSDQSIPADYPVFLDGTKTYAYLAGEAIGANVRVTQASGYGCVSGFNTDGVNLQQLYPYTNYWRDTDLYAFDPPAQIVVINLATNDALSQSITGLTDAAFKEGALNLMSMARAKNPDAKIVWCTGMMGTFYPSILQEAVAELGGAQSGYFYCELPYGVDGGYGHPNVEQHEAAAEVLEAFLLENCLPEDHLTDFATWDELQGLLTSAKAVASPSTELQSAMRWAQAELDWGTTDEYRLGCRYQALLAASRRTLTVDLMPKKNIAVCPVESNGSYIWPYYDNTDGSVTLYKGGEGYYWPKIETLLAPRTVNIYETPYLRVVGKGTAYFNLYLGYKDADGTDQSITLSRLCGNGDVDIYPGELDFLLDLRAYIESVGHADTNGNIVLTSCYIYSSGEMDTYIRLETCMLTSNNESDVPTQFEGDFSVDSRIIYDVPASTNALQLYSAMNQAKYLTVVNENDEEVVGAVATGMRVLMTVKGLQLTHAWIAVTGDADGDGLVTTQDCRQTLIASFSETEYFDYTEYAMDVNRDKSIDSTDVRHMLTMCVA